MSLPFELSTVRSVTFYKRDELTTDLICCDVDVDHTDGVLTWFNHEEADDWINCIEAFETLPGFDTNWRSKVVQPPFAYCVTLAYLREGVEPAASKD